MTRRSAALGLFAAVLACDAPARTASDVERWRLQMVQRIGGADIIGDACAFHGVVGAVRLEDGRLVVADRGSGELLWHDAQGVHVQLIVGAGDAGAFRGLVGLQHTRGDSLAVFDALRLVHLLDSDGEFGRRLLLRVYAPEGGLAETIGPFPAVEYDGRGRPIFSPSTSIAVAGDRIVVWSGG